MTNGNIMGDAFHTFLPYYFGMINPIVHTEHNKEYKLNENQIKTIMCIHHLDSVMPSVISQVFNIQKGSLTTIIKSLIQLDLIKKSYDAKNERSYYLTLTSKGQSFVAYKQKKIKKEFELLFDNMPQEEVEQVSAAFELLSKYLDRKRDL